MVNSKLKNKDSLCYEASCASREVSIVFFLPFLLLVITNVCICERHTLIFLSFIQFSLSFIRSSFSSFLLSWSWRARTNLCSVGTKFQRKRLSLLKPAVYLSVYVEKPWCLFLLTDAEVSTRKKTFAEVQTERLDQAERTVLIKCPSKLNEKKLLQYLSSHGNVKSHFFFENRVSN